MDKKLNQNMPIYIQIMNSVKKSVISGELKSGERVPSVREFAQEFGVNPNTMQRALNELEREGLLISERTTGRFVTKDLLLIQNLKFEMAVGAFDNFINEMRMLGFNDEEIRDFFRTKSDEASKISTKDASDGIA